MVCASGAVLNCMVLRYFLTLNTRLAGPSQHRVSTLLQSQLTLLLDFETSNHLRTQLMDVFDEMLRAQRLRSGVDRDDRAEGPSKREVLGMKRDSAASVQHSTTRSGTSSSTLSAWMFRRLTEPQEDHGQCVHGLDEKDVHFLQERLDDMLFVLKHTRSCIKQRSDPVELLMATLECLSISPALVPLHRALESLRRVRIANASDPTFASAKQAESLLPGLEVIETLVVEALETMHHPLLAPLYPSTTDKFSVLVDVWGMDDRRVVATAARCT